ncbi:MAG: hypothetical protein C0615_08830, partial [Desulfuromonas sp.]
RVIGYQRMRFKTMFGLSYSSPVGVTNHAGRLNSFRSRDHCCRDRIIISRLTKDFIVGIAGVPLGTMRIVTPEAGNAAIRCTII